MFFFYFAGSATQHKKKSFGFVKVRLDEEKLAVINFNYDDFHQFWEILVRRRICELHRRDGDEMRCLSILSHSRWWTQVHHLLYFFEWKDGTKVVYEGAKDREKRIISSARLFPCCHLGHDQQQKYKGRQKICTLQKKSKKIVHIAAFENSCNFNSFCEENNNYYDWIERFGDSLGVNVKPPFKESKEKKKKII